MYSGSSNPGQAAIRDFGVKEKNSQLQSNYFCRYSGEEPVFTEKEFMKTCRMPQNLYEKIRSDIADYDVSSQSSQDSRRRRGASSVLRVLTEFLVLADIRAAFSMFKEVHTFEQQNTDVMKSLCRLM